MLAFPLHSALPLLSSPSATFPLKERNGRVRAVRSNEQLAPKYNTLFSLFYIDYHARPDLLPLLTPSFHSLEMFDLESLSPLFCVLFLCMQKDPLQ